MRARLLVVVVFLAGGLMAPAKADADAPGEASARFQKGVTLFDAGDFAAALAEFQAAMDLRPHPKVLFNIAITQKALFQYGDAIESLQRYLEQTAAKPTWQRAEAERTIQELRGRVAEVSILVEGPAGALVQVDGNAQGVAPLNKTVYWRPGRHRVEVSADGYVTAVRTPKVVSGQQRRVVVTLEKKAAPLTTGVLRVTTTPKAARVSLDGNRVGSSPWSGPVKAGGHQLTVDLAGYATKTREITLLAGQNRSVALELQPRQEDSSIWGRWELWAGVGAVVVAGSVAAFALSGDSPGPDEVFVLR